MALTFVAGSLAWPAAAGALHEEGVLTVERREWSPGDSVRIVGAKFGKGAALRLLLVGAAGEIDWGSVTADAAGGFRITLEVPHDVRPGTYRLVAVASDGDEVAALDIAVVPGSAAHTAPEPQSAPPAETPSAEPLALPRARSPWTTGGALAVIALSVAGAWTLLRGSNRTTEEEAR